ncbi:hypothetical protein DIPPA_18567 [Diplonema papillatum]|nr:hypothetical protein DIPPA_18567 [Diplonema papillatum]
MRERTISLRTSEEQRRRSCSFEAPSLLTLRFWYGPALPSDPRVLDGRVYAADGARQQPRLPLRGAQPGLSIS